MSLFQTEASEEMWTETSGPRGNGKESDRGGEWRLTVLCAGRFCPVCSL